MYKTLILLAVPLQTDLSFLNLFMCSYIPFFKVWITFCTYSSTQFLSGLFLIYVSSIFWILFTTGNNSMHKWIPHLIEMVRISKKLLRMSDSLIIISLVLYFKNNASLVKVCLKYHIQFLRVVSPMKTLVLACYMHIPYPRPKKKGFKKY